MMVEGEEETKAVKGQLIQWLDTGPISKEGGWFQKYDSWVNEKWHGMISQAKPTHTYWRGGPE